MPTRKHKTKSSAELQEAWKQYLARDRREEIILEQKRLEEHESIERDAARQLAEEEPREMEQIALLEKRFNKLLRGDQELAALPVAYLRHDLPFPKGVPLRLVPQVSRLRELRRRIAQRENAVEQNPSSKRRAYKSEVRAYMEANDLSSVHKAADHLGVGYDILKNIMTSRGKKRYGEETLKDVLKKVRGARG